MQTRETFHPCCGKSVELGHARGCPNEMVEGFTREEIWHEQRALGCTEEQAVRSLRDAEARLDD